jgi:phospholipase C
MPHSLDRRRFLTLSAAGATVAAGLGGATDAAAATGTTPAAGAKAASPAATGTIADVQHVVVLMQENRSFDHYFGTLQGVRGFDDASAIQIAGGFSVFDQPDGSGRQYPWALNASSPTGQSETLAQCDGDLAHSWSDQHDAWHGGLMDAWVAAKGTNRTMGYLTRADIPFHYALADNWTICDAYHCSILSATGPNRTYLWSGWIDPDGTAGGPAYDGGEESGLSWQTYAEALQNAGLSWRVYQNAGDNFGDNGLAYFSQFANAPAGSPLASYGMASVPSVTGSTPDDIAAAIRADVLAGTLPRVSWVVADQQSSEHPYATPEDGAHFVNLVIQAINADPDVANSTVLLLNYDENDGLFDHVPPPVAPSGTAGEFYDGTNIGLGFRVPLIAISPWSRGGWVNSEVCDHTSVLRFLETWTAALGTPVTCPNISAWRRSVCGDLTSMFDFTSPVYGLPALPDTSRTIGLATCGPLPNPSPSGNTRPSQEPGTRPARALPYQPNAYLDHLEYDSDGAILVWLDMTNQGAPATGTAHFATYVNAYRGGGPWQYSVAGGGQTSDFYNCGPNYGGGPYDLTVIGPNRFFRRFVGNANTAGAKLAVLPSYAVESGTGKLAIWFAMTNNSTASATFTITANQYRTDGPWTYTVAPGKTTSDFFNAVAYNNGWYDFTVTADADPAWSQRFSGHLETNQPSITG